MRILFSQVYAEVNTELRVTNTLLNEVSSRLNSFGYEFNHYQKLFNGDDYSIVFVISATREKKDLVKGPLTISKDRKVYFTIFNQYKESLSFVDEMTYVLDNILKGISLVFNKYGTDLFGVNESIDEVKKLLIDNPEKYKEWNK